MKLPTHLTQTMQVILRPYDDSTWYRESEGENEEQIKADGFQIFLTRERGFYQHDDDVVLGEVEVTIPLPAVDENELVLKAIDTLRQKITDEQADSVHRVQKLLDKINGLTLIEYQPKDA